MTNQTIDGVPRELLTQWLAMFEGGIASSPLSALRELTRKYLQTEPAAQPQGEPVAYLDLEKIQPGGMAYATKMRVNHRQTALYAEQPAPVAVVLPERLNHSDGLHTYEYVTGHNAAIDKMLGVPK